MKNKLFLFSFILIFTFLSVSFLQARNASAQKIIFISMLSKIPGYKIVKDYGFDIFYGHEGGFNKRGIKYQYDEIYKSAESNKPNGANACIELRLFKLKRNGGNLPALTAYCEYVELEK